MDRLLRRVAPPEIKCAGFKPMIDVGIERAVVEFFAQFDEPPMPPTPKPRPVR